MGRRTSRKILVLGSSNIDLIFRIPRFHRPGETIMGKNLLTVFGGKGANQAMASKRLGAQVIFITKLGNDHYGEDYRRYLIRNGLNRRFILKDKGNPSGVALIELSPEGENRIIVSPGANGSLSKNDLKRLPLSWKTICLFVSQLETPLITVRWGLEAAKGQGVTTVLNPSPPVSLPSGLLSLVDYLVPNESEAECLTGIRMKGLQDAKQIARRLLEMGVKNVVLTLGSKGLYFKNRDEEVWMKAFRVTVKDTTAAGDAFMGGLACGLSENRPIREVLRLANGAGALATTRMGAQPSLPLREDLDVFLSQTVP